MLLHLSFCVDSHLYVVNYLQCYISVSFLSCYCSHLIPILRIYKDMQCFYDYLFTIFQYHSHRHDIFSHYDLILCSALMPDMFCWISSAHNCVACLHYNLYNLTIINASKCVAICAYFLQLGILGRPLVLIFFIKMVNSCHFLYIPRRAVFVTVSFTIWC